MPHLWLLGSQCHWSHVLASNAVIPIFATCPWPKRIPVVVSHCFSSIKSTGPARCYGKLSGSPLVATWEIPSKSFQLNPPFVDHFPRLPPLESPLKIRDFAATFDTGPTWSSKQPCELWPGFVKRWHWRKRMEIYVEIMANLKSWLGYSARYGQQATNLSKTQRYHVCHYPNLRKCKLAQKLGHQSTSGFYS